jgi:hypothetical protein
MVNTHLAPHSAHEGMQNSTPNKFAKQTKKKKKKKKKRLRTNLPERILRRAKRLAPGLLKLRLLLMRLLLMLLLLLLLLRILLERKVRRAVAVLEPGKGTAEMLLLLLLILLLLLLLLEELLLLLKLLLLLLLLLLLRAAAGPHGVPEGLGRTAAPAGSPGSVGGRRTAAPSCHRKCEGISEIKKIGPCFLFWVRGFLWMRGCSVWLEIDLYRSLGFFSQFL